MQINDVIAQYAIERVHLMAELEKAHARIAELEAAKETD
jgi:hypothetical protein